MKKLQQYNIRNVIEKIIVNLNHYLFSDKMTCIYVIRHITLTQYFLICKYKISKKSDQKKKLCRYDKKKRADYTRGKDNGEGRT